MSVTKGKFAKRWDAKEGRKSKLRAEDGVVGDLIIANDNGNVGIAVQVVGVDSRARNILQGENLELLQRGSDRDDEALASRGV